MLNHLSTAIKLKTNKQTKNKIKEETTTTTTTTKSRHGPSHSHCTHDEYRIIHHQCYWPIIHAALFDRKDQRHKTDEQKDPSVHALSIDQDIAVPLADHILCCI